MTLRKIAIFPNSEYDREYTYTAEAVRVLSENGILSVLSSSAKPFFKDSSLSVSFLDEADAMMDAADAILVLGGDGTMIDYSVRAAEKNKPSVGVNLGHLGFLMALERTEIEKLALLAKGDFTVESRMLLDARIVLDGKTVHSQRILNDIVIASGVRSKIAEFSLFCTPEGRLDYRADGIIVATPTGSTAYSFSAGGPIIEPRARLIMLTPICPHSLNRTSIILSPEDVIEIEIPEGKEGMPQTVDANFDGGHTVEMHTGDRIRVMESEKITEFIQLNQVSFLELLHKKMSE